MFFNLFALSNTVSDISHFFSLNLSHPVANALIYLADHVVCSRTQCSQMHIFERGSSQAMQNKIKQNSVNKANKHSGASCPLYTCLFYFLLNRYIVGVSNESAQGFKDNMIYSTLAHSITAFH